MIQAQTDRLNKLCVKFGFEFDINPNTVKPYAEYLIRCSPSERMDSSLYRTALYRTAWPGSPMGAFYRAVEDSVTELSFQELHVKLVSRLRNCVLLK
jgi:hypothetical protein